MAAAAGRASESIRAHFETALSSDIQEYQSKGGFGGGRRRQRTAKLISKGTNLTPSKLESEGKIILYLMIFNEIACSKNL